MNVYELKIPAKATRKTKICIAATKYSSGSEDDVSSKGLLPPPLIISRMNYDSVRVSGAVSLE